MLDLREDEKNPLNKHQEEADQKEKNKGKKKLSVLGQD